MSQMELATAISCIDGRTQLPAIACLKEKRAASKSIVVVKNTKLRVKESHRASFDYSLAFRKGDKVKIGKENPKMPGWFWCENKDGVWSWIPEEYLVRRDSEGTITHVYDTTELTVAVGEIVECLREVKFWTLCRASDGREGWLPTACLERTNK